MAITVGVFEAKTKLSELLERVARGEEVVITRRGVPVAQLVAPPSPEMEFDNWLERARALRSQGKSGPESIKELIEQGRHR